MSKDPEGRAHELIEELNRTLNREFEDTAAYREAYSYLDIILDGLDEDERRNGNGD